MCHNTAVLERCAEFAGKGTSVKKTVFSLDSVILDSSWAGQSLTCEQLRLQSFKLHSCPQMTVRLHFSLEDVVNQRVSLLVSALLVKVTHQPRDFLASWRAQTELA